MIKNQIGLKELIDECLYYNRNNFEFLTLSYKVLTLKIGGIDVSDLYLGLKRVNKDSKDSVNKQFLSFVDNDLSKSLVEDDDFNLLKFGYKANYLRLKSSLNKTGRVTNKVGLLTLSNDIKTFMTTGWVKYYNESQGMTLFNNLIKDKVDKFKGTLDRISYSNLVLG